MNREIRYRAWHKEKKIMCDVLLICFVNRYVDVLPEYQIEGGNQEEWQFDEIELMQYTSVIDEKRKPVFESDIVRICSPSDRREPFIAEVYYCVNTASFSGRVNGGYPVDLFLHNPNSDAGWIPEIRPFIPTRTIEIIGNIYNHPHLVTPNQAQK